MSESEHELQVGMTVLCLEVKKFTDTYGKAFIIKDEHRNCKT